MASLGPKVKLLREDIRRRLLDGIRAGATYELACKYAGISRSTFYEWMAAGREGREPYASFLMEVHDAEGAGSVQLLATIRKAASNGQWQAAAWMLERRYPKMYGRFESRSQEENDPNTEACDLTTPEGQAAAAAAVRSLPRAVLERLTRTG